ncbi:hypothetical protein GT354_29145, partial [Streptomyces sp. SID3343]|nr:hypothetical protein [Streptomyces sp. SID3343]
GSGLSDTVSGDLADALHAAFEPLWVMLERDPAEASRRGAKAELEPVLRSYGDHLAHNGVQAAPPFARRRQDRPHVGDAVGSDADRIAELLAQTPDRPMLQLCGPDHLILLDHVATSARNVRFAPRGVRPAVRDALRDRRAGHVVDSELVWTSGGRMAGVLRLLPLLPGTVDDAWIWEPSGAERADGSTDIGGPGAGPGAGRGGDRGGGFDGRPETGRESGYGNEFDGRTRGGREAGREGDVEDGFGGGFEGGGRAS